LEGHYVTLSVLTKHCTSGQAGWAVSKGKNSFTNGKTGKEAHVPGFKYKRYFTSTSKQK
jgi:hypothetical protein